MIDLIVYAGDHSNVKEMAGLFIVSAFMIIIVLITYLFRNKRKKK